MPDAGGPFHHLVSNHPAHFSRSDWLANVLLYIPLGFFSIQILRNRPGWSHVLLATLVAGMLSTCMEVAQFYDATRDSCLSDISANTTGALLGAVAGVCLHRRAILPSAQRAAQYPIVVLLLVSWLGYRLFPYVPVIDLHQYWHAVRPLFLEPTLSPVDLYRHTVIWLALALLLEALVGALWARWAFVLFVPALLGVRIVIDGIILSPAEVLGGGIAVLLWIAVLFRLPSRATLVTILFVGVVLIVGLRPFRFTAGPQPFGLVPFLSFMHGSLTVNVCSFFEKAFSYGALLWLARRAGSRLEAATLWGGALVLSISLTHVYMPGRSAEITDLLLLLILAGIMKLLPESPEQMASPSSPG